MSARVSGVRISLLQLALMRLRNVPPNIIVPSLIEAHKAGLNNITRDNLEAHYMTGGHVQRVVHALVSASKANIDLSFEKATAIDPGHGGPASGATYESIQEKDVNLKIAKYLKTYLEQYVGVQVYMTRTTDVDLTLSKRVENSVANNADVFISIHNNASSNLDTSGAIVFYPNYIVLSSLGVPLSCIS